MIFCTSLVKVEFKNICLQDDGLRLSSSAFKRGIIFALFQDYGVTLSAHDRLKICNKIVFASVGNSFKIL